MINAVENYVPVEDVAKEIGRLKWIEHEIVALMAGENHDNYLLVKEAFDAGGIKADLRWVEDGEEVMYYLLYGGEHPDALACPRPHLIMLDLIMPRKDGLETLREIKGHHHLRKIPVVLLASPRKQNHPYSGLKLGADSFIIKPIDLDDMTKMAGSLPDYFFGIVRLPERVQPPDFFADRIPRFPGAFFRSLH